ncbi:hypothetical protein KFK09_002270 [Dendrobium nobile]|uniref:Uncharacterized protein n=1 Tax=Dendrobium nobile TaxID=94219 RepID=A0A8T3C7H0_DENNO|nr:hypothetical protein KFK09_002270 [Dendrobium nobile]
MRISGFLLLMDLHLILNHFNYCTAIHFYIFLMNSCKHIFHLSNGALHIGYWIGYNKAIMNVGPVLIIAIYWNSSSAKNSHIFIM